MLSDFTEGEGTETFRLTLTEASTPTYIEVNILDSSVTTYSLSSSLLEVDENQNNTFVITLITEGLQNGSVVPYTISGVQTSDFVPALASLEGSFTINNNTASLPLTVFTDSDTGEGTETFRLTLTGASVPIYIEVSILDTSSEASLTPSVQGTPTNTLAAGDEVSLDLT